MTPVCTAFLFSMYSYSIQRALHPQAVFIVFFGQKERNGKLPCRRCGVCFKREFAVYFHWHLAWRESAVSVLPTNRCTNAHFSLLLQIWQNNYTQDLCLPVKVLHPHPLDAIPCNVPCWLRHFSFSFSNLKKKYKIFHFVSAQNWSTYNL